jgi:methyl-accepting chemotaxis protein
MRLLSRLKIRTKLVVLAGLSLICVLAMLAAAGALIREGMTEDRIDKARAVVHAVRGQVDALVKREAAGALTRDQALGELQAMFAAMRYDNGDGYFFAISTTGGFMAHGVKPSLVGVRLATPDTKGRIVTEAAAKALETSPEFITRFRFAKPGVSGDFEKIGYFVKVPAWGMMIGTGVYTDDLDVAFYRCLEVLAGIGAAVVLVAGLVAWLLGRDLSGALTRLHLSMGRLANGDLSTPIDGTARRDEAGEMARAVTVFREHMQQARTLAAEQEAARETAEKEKRSALTAMAERVEGDTESAMARIRQCTADMLVTADLMTASATRTGAAAQTAAGSAGQAVSGAQTVAAATEELTASIREISRQVEQSSAIVGRAVVAGTETRATITELGQQVEEIGAVATMIAEIAAKTNLLALNATIEAARAGEAGKGFAVVASEVKALATQTARSTETITHHIDRIRSATGASVAAVGRIEATIKEVDSIAGSIAAAVEEQGAATAEIARNVASTAQAAEEMSGRTRDVSAEAGETDRQAASVREGAAAMEAAIGELRQSLVRVVRTATPEVNRRAADRSEVDLGCQVTIGGRSLTGYVRDLSDGGARLRLTEAAKAAAGARGAIELDTVPGPVPFLVVAAEGDSLRIKFERPLGGSAGHSLAA